MPDPTILEDTPNPMEKNDFRGCQAYLDSLNTNVRRITRRLARVDKLLATELPDIQLDYYVKLKRRMVKRIVALQKGMDDLISKVPKERRPAKFVGTTAIPNITTELLVDSECGAAYDKTFKEMRRY